MTRIHCLWMFGYSLLLAMCVDDYKNTFSYFSNQISCISIPMVAQFINSSNISDFFLIQKKVNKRNALKPVIFPMVSMVVLCFFYPQYIRPNWKSTEFVVQIPHSVLVVDQMSTSKNVLLISLSHFRTLLPPVLSLFDTMFRPAPV